MLAYKGFEFLRKQPLLTSKLKTLNSRIDYQQSVLNETRHILNSNYLTGYYQKDLRKIYKDAVFNYKNNKLKNTIKLFKNNNHLYQQFIIKNYNYIPVIKIFICIDNDLNEQYITISNNQYDNEFNSNALPLYKKEKDSYFINGLYSVIINLNSNDIADEYTEYNIGALEHEFIHIFQFIQNQFINDNSCNASYLADQILSLRNNKGFGEIDNIDLIKSLADNTNFNIKNLLFVFACCVYYCDYSERAAHMHTIKAEINQIFNWKSNISVLRRKAKNIIETIINDPTNRLEYLLDYSRTYSKYYFLREILKNIINNKLISKSNKTFIEDKILNNYNIDIDLKKNFNDLLGNQICRSILNKDINEIGLYNFFQLFLIAINKQIRNANVVINDIIKEYEENQNS